MTTDIRGRGPKIERPGPDGRGPKIDRPGPDGRGPKIERPGPDGRGPKVERPGPDRGPKIERPGPDRGSQIGRPGPDRGPQIGRPGPGRGPQIGRPGPGRGPQIGRPGPGGDFRRNPMPKPMPHPGHGGPHVHHGKPGDKDWRPHFPGKPGGHWSHHWSKDRRPVPGIYRPVPQKTIYHVRKHFHGYKNYWTTDWYRRHPHAWHTHVIPATRWWYRPSWASTWGWFGAGFFTGAVVNNVVVHRDYCYGTNIIYRDNYVYIDGKRHASYAEYYKQALLLALSVKPIVIQNTTVVVDQPVLTSVEEGGEWMPLGSFAVFWAGDIPEDSGEAVTSLMQLATNKKGEIRGNYFSEDGDSVIQIVGAMDPQSQRIAMRFADDESMIMEGGLWHLTQDSVPFLVHYGEDYTEQMNLIRLSDSETGE